MLINYLILTFPKDSFPWKTLTLSEILNNWLYLAIRSDLDIDPVLICCVFNPTAKSAIEVSSLSPERCDITHVYPFSFANLIVSIVSVTDPIWLGLIKIELAILRSIPSFKISLLVTNKSSPTI